MLTVADVRVKLSKISDLSHDFVLNVEDRLENVIFELSNGKSIEMECDEAEVLALLSNDSEDDTIYVEKLVDTYYEKVGVTPDDIELVVLNGSIFKVINYNDMKLLHNEESKLVEYSCHGNDLITLMQSIDESYRVFIRDYVFL